MATLWSFVFLLTAHATKQRLIELSDPLYVIRDCMNNTDQNNVFRFVSKRCNYYQKTFLDSTRNSISKLTQYAQQIIIENHEMTNEISKDLQRISNQYKFNEYYLKRWPLIIKHCIQQNYRPHDAVWMNNFNLFRSALSINAKKCINMNAQYQMLILVSHSIFQQFIIQNTMPEFDLFMYQFVWQHLQKRNQIPPLKSIYYLNVNQEIYTQQIGKLEQLMQNGLIIWHPAFIIDNNQWTANNFEFYIGNFCEILQDIQDGEQRDDFISMFVVHFVLKLLKNSDYNLQIMVKTELVLLFQGYVRDSIHFLWKNQDWDLLEEILLALHRNNGMGILNNYTFLNSLKEFGQVTFIEILLHICMNDEISITIEESIVMAKSVYFWFITGEKRRAVLIIVNEEKNARFVSIIREFMKDIIQKAVPYLSTESVQIYIDSVMSIILQNSPLLK